MKKVITYLLESTESLIGTDIRYLTKSGSLLLLSQGIAAAASFLALIIFSHFLPQDTFGVYRYILSFVGILSIFSLSGLSSALTQAIAQGYDGSLYKIFKIKLKWGTLATCAALCIAAYYYIHGNIIFSLSFAVMAFGIPIMNAFGVYKSVLMGKQLFRKVTITDIFSVCISTLSMVGAVFVTQNVFILISVYVASLVCINTILFLYVTRTVPLNYAKNPQTLSYGKHLSLMTVIGMIASQLDKILIFHYLGAVELSIYFIALAPVERLRSMLGNIETLAFLKLAKQNILSLKKFLPRKIRIFELAVVGIVLVYIGTAPTLFGVFFPQYEASIVYSQVAALLLLFVPRTLFTAAFSAHMRTRELYITRIVGPVTRIATLFIFIRMWGIWGALVSMVVTETILYTVYAFLFRRMQ